MTQLNTKTSITDLLKSKGLPHDQGFKGTLYQSLGLGTPDEFLKGSVSGETNIKLLEKLSGDASVLDKISAGMNLGGNLPSLAPTAPAPVRVPAADANASALPTTVDEINKFQKDTLTRFTDSTKKLDDATASLAAQKPKTIDSILGEITAVKNSLGLDKLEGDYKKLVQTIRKSEDDIRAEVQASGGVATESQIKALAAERNKALEPEFDRLSGEIATKSAMAELIQKRLGIEEDKADDRARQLLDLYRGDSNRAYDALLKFYDDDTDEVREQLKIKREEKRSILDLSIKYPAAGINVGKDSVETAYSKAMKEAKTYDDLEELKLRYDVENERLSILLKKQDIYPAPTFIPAPSNSSSTSSSTPEKPKPAPFNAKQLDTVKKIISKHPGEWGNAADEIDRTFGAGTATQYDNLLKSAYDPKKNKALNYNDF